MRRPGNRREIGRRTDIAVMPRGVMQKKVIMGRAEHSARTMPAIRNGSAVREFETRSHRRVSRVCRGWKWDAEEVEFKSRHVSFLRR